MSYMEMDPTLQPDSLMPQPAQQPMQQPVPQPAPQPVQQPMQQPVPQPAPQSVQQPMQQPVPQPAPQPVQQPMQQPVPQPAPQPVQQPMQQPVPQPAPQPVQQPMQQPIPQSAPQPMQQPMYGAPQQPMYGAPQQPMYGAAPQQPMYGYDPSMYGYGMPQGQQPTYGYGMPQQGAPMYDPTMYGAPQQPMYGYDPSMYGYGYGYDGQAPVFAQGDQAPTFDTAEAQESEPEVVDARKIPFLIKLFALIQILAVGAIAVFCALETITALYPAGLNDFFAKVVTDLPTYFTTFTKMTSFIYICVFALVILLSVIAIPAVLFSTKGAGGFTRFILNLELFAVITSPIVLFCAQGADNLGISLVDAIVTHFTSSNIVELLLGTYWSRAVALTIPLGASSIPVAIEFLIIGLLGLHLLNRIFFGIINKPLRVAKKARKAAKKAAKK